MGNLACCCESNTFNSTSNFTPFDPTQQNLRKVKGNMLKPSEIDDMFDTHRGDILTPRTRTPLDDYGLSARRTELQSLTTKHKSFVEWRAKVPFQPKFVAFGQKRFQGFRDKIEFDQKRYVVAD